MVLDNILEISKVRKIAKIIIPIITNVEIIEAPIPLKLLATNIVAIEIKNGNLPITRN